MWSHFVETGSFITSKLQRGNEGKPEHKVTYKPGTTKEDSETVNCLILRKKIMVGKRTRKHLTVFHLKTRHGNKYCYYVINTDLPALPNLCLPLAESLHFHFHKLPVQQGTKFGVRTPTPFSTLTSCGKSEGQCSSGGFRSPQDS